MAQPTNNQLTVKEKAKNPESKYSVAELASAARTKFKVSPELAAVALNSAKKDKMTVAEAEKIIKEFKGKKVQ